MYAMAWGNPEDVMGGGHYGEGQYANSKKKNQSQKTTFCVPLFIRNV